MESEKTIRTAVKRPEHNPADAVLIKRFLQGDEAAFSELYHRYRRQLYAFLNNLIGPGAECDEVFEETWLKVIDRLSGYRDDGRFGAWLFRVSRNIFYDRLRRTRKERELVSLDMEEPPQVAAPLGNGPGERLELGEIEVLVSKAVAGLPTELKETFLLRQQGVAFKEIAEGILFNFAPVKDQCEKYYYDVTTKTISAF